MSVLNPPAPLGARAQALLDKEKLSNKPTELQKKINKIKSNGINYNDNLCVFGIHNPKFIKDAEHRNSI